MATSATTILLIINYDIDKNKYKDYHDVLTSSKPIETCRPAAISNTNENNLPKIPFRAEVNRARYAITCAECKKGRLLFSEKKLTPNEVQKINDFFDDQPFVCGTPVFENDSELNEKLFQLPNNTCNKPMTAMYYSSYQKKVRGCKSICSYCHTVENFAVESPHYVGLPRCSECQENNFSITHRKLKLGNNK